MSRQNFFIFAYIVNCMTPLTIALKHTILITASLLAIFACGKDPGTQPGGNNDNPGDTGLRSRCGKVLTAEEAAAYSSREDVLGF